jgi:hypothetical protein
LKTYSHERSLPKQLTQLYCVSRNDSRNVLLFNFFDMWINITDDSIRNEFQAEFEIFDYSGEFKFRMFRDETFDIYDVEAVTSEGDDYNLNDVQMEGLYYWLQELIDKQGICYDNGSRVHEWDEHWTCGI